MTAETTLAIKQFLIICLGLFGATTLLFSLVPSLQRRNARRTRLKALAGMPMSPEEIGADRDRLRAQFVTQQRRVEQKLETQTVKLTEEMAELGRRAARIAQLEKETARLMSENAALQSKQFAHSEEALLLAAEKDESSASADNLRKQAEEEAAALRRLMSIMQSNLEFMTRECDQLRDQLLSSKRIVVKLEPHSSAQHEGLASLRNAIAEFGEQIAARKRIKDK